MNNETIQMYLNTLKTVLTKKNFEILKERFGKDKEELEFFLKKFHQLGRDKKKFNKFFQDYIAGVGIFGELNRAIELHEKAIEKLKRLKEVLVP